MAKKRLEEADDKVGYPFAVALRLRVVQVVCGISMLVMGAVALIEEKSLFNLGLGVPAGISTVIAAANNIYSSRGFDGYQPSSCQATSIWMKFRILGPTFRTAALNILLWSTAIVLQAALSFKAVKTISPETVESVTVYALAVIEFLLTSCVAITLLSVTWVDLTNDPDWQEPPDLAHSNTGTAVSMVTLSQAPTLV